VRLIAKRAFQSDFTGWSGDCSGAENACSVTMTEDRDATATFEQHPG
jgi:uncharacterized repeat protein (TIGR02543 family)